MFALHGRRYVVGGFNLIRENAISVKTMHVYTRVGTLGSVWRSRQNGNHVSCSDFHVGNEAVVICFGLKL